ncbi:MAG: lipoprotein [Casimicrobiaceae bacterium]
MTLRMLRRFVAAFLVCLTIGAVAGCGIKGPLKLPPAKPGAPEPAAMPQPSRPDAETPSPVPPDATPEVKK